MPHCTTCHKKYTRLTGLQRHRAVCELLSRSSFCKKADLEEQADLPPLTELWSIVKTLATQVEKQQKRNSTSQTIRESSTKKNKRKRMAGYTFKTHINISRMDRSHRNHRATS